MNLILVRTVATATETLGVLYDATRTKQIAVTLEREFDNGSNRKSTPTRPGACIPAGVYACARVNSPKFGNVYEVKNVPGRTAILIHAGNLADDSRGCILLGTRHGKINGQHAALESKKALAAFHAAHTGPFTLTIVNEFAGKPKP